jgi:hypothetical protein
MHATHKIPLVHRVPAVRDHRRELHRPGAISYAIPVIQRDLHLSHADTGIILGAFGLGLPSPRCSAASLSIATAPALFILSAAWVPLWYFAFRDKCGLLRGQCRHRAASRGQRAGADGFRLRRRRLRPYPHRLGAAPARLVHRRLPADGRARFVLGAGRAALPPPDQDRESVEKQPA